MRLVVERLAGADGSAVFTRLSVTGAAAHSAFELGCGAGIPLMALVGPYGAAASWAAATVQVWRSGWPARGGDKARSFLNGVSVAGVATHYIAWPFRFAAPGLPWLITAEGLPPSHMPAYNLVLYSWGAAAVIALVRESRHPGWAVLGLATTPLLVVAAGAEYRWLVRQATRNPSWWNRSVGLRP